MSELFEKWSAHFQKTSTDHSNQSLSLTGDEAFVFDCDQTLIHGDIGEATLRLALERRWVISHDAWWQHLIEAEFSTAEINSWRQGYELEANRISTEHEKDKKSASLSQELWEAYEKLCMDDVESAYIFAARIAYQRHPVELALITDSALQQDEQVRFRPSVISLVQEIQKQAKVWIVSSSHIGIVRVIAHHYNIPSQQVIGIDFALDKQQTYSQNLIQPAPIGPKKINAFQVLNQAQPFLMVGDSKHDLPMMHYAKSALFIDHHKSIGLRQSAQELGAMIVDSKQL